MEELTPYLWESRNESQQKLLTAFNIWAGMKFVNNLGYPIKVYGIKVMCKDGTTGTYAWASPTQSTKDEMMITSPAQKPGTALNWVSYSFQGYLPIGVDDEFYAGIKGTSSSTAVSIRGYAHPTGNIYSVATTSGAALQYNPTFGTSGGRIFNMRVLYERAYTDPYMGDVTITRATNSTNLTVNWDGWDGEFNMVQSFYLKIINSITGAVVYSQNVGNVKTKTVSVARGATYYAEVYAVGSYSNSLPEKSSNITVPAIGAPSVSGQTIVVTNSSGTSSTNDKYVKVSWNGTNGTEGNTISSYTYELYNSSGTLIKSGSQTSKSIIIGPLTRNITYYAKIKANGSLGVNSGYATTSNVTIVAATAPTPSDLSIAIVNSSGTVTSDGKYLKLSWTAATSGIDNPVDKYSYYFYLDGNSTAINSASTTNLASTIYGPVERGKTYYGSYKVSGTGGLTSTVKTSSKVTIKDYSAVGITISSATANANTITVKFNGTNGFDNPISKFECYCVLSGSNYTNYVKKEIVSASATSCIFTNLAWDTSYDIYVSAIATNSKNNTLNAQANKKGISTGIDPNDAPDAPKINRDMLESGIQYSVEYKLDSTVNYIMKMWISGQPEITFPLNSSSTSISYTIKDWLKMLNSSLYTEEYLAKNDVDATINAALAYAKDDGTVLSTYSSTASAKIVHLYTPFASSGETILITDNSSKNNVLSSHKPIIKINDNAENTLENSYTSYVLNHDDTAIYKNVVDGKNQIINLPNLSRYAPEGGSNKVSNLVINMLRKDLTSGAISAEGSMIYTIPELGKANATLIDFVFDRTTRNVTVTALVNSQTQIPLQDFINSFNSTTSEWYYGIYKARLYCVNIYGDYYFTEWYDASSVVGEVINENYEIYYEFKVLSSEELVVVGVQIAPVDNYFGDSYIYTGKKDINDTQAIGGLLKDFTLNNTVIIPKKNYNGIYIKKNESWINTNQAYLPNISSSTSGWIYINGKWVQILI